MIVCLLTSFRSTPQLFLLGENVFKMRILFLGMEDGSVAIDAVDHIIDLAANVDTGCSGHGYSVLRSFYFLILKVPNASYTNSGVYLRLRSNLFYQKSLTNGSRPAAAR